MATEPMNFATKGVEVLIVIFCVPFLVYRLRHPIITLTYNVLKLPPDDRIAKGVGNTMHLFQCLLHADRFMELCCHALDWYVRSGIFRDNQSLYPSLTTNLKKCDGVMIDCY